MYDGSDVGLLVGGTIIDVSTLVDMIHTWQGESGRFYTRFNHLSSSLQLLLSNEHHHWWLYSLLSLLELLKSFIMIRHKDEMYPVMKGLEACQFFSIFDDLGTAQRKLWGHVSQMVSEMARQTHHTFIYSPWCPLLPMYGYMSMSSLSLKATLGLSWYYNQRF